MFEKILETILAINMRILNEFTMAAMTVADEEKAYIIRNRHPMMAKITGSGCILQ